jgi:hypothetical protein
MDALQLSNKTVLVEISFGNRYHHRDVGAIRVRDSVVEIVVPSTCRVPGKELTVLRLTNEQVNRLRPSRTGGHDLIFDGVYCFNGPIQYEAQARTDFKQLTSPPPG